MALDPHPTRPIPSDEPEVEYEIVDYGDDGLGSPIGQALPALISTLLAQLGGGSEGRILVEVLAYSGYVTDPNALRSLYDANPGPINALARLIDVEAITRRIITGRVEVSPFPNDPLASISAIVPPTALTGLGVLAGGLLTTLFQKG